MNSDRHAWTPEPFETDDGTVPFETFIHELSDFKFVALDTAIERVLAVRGLDLVRTEWLKALGDGLHEFRVRHYAEEIARMQLTGVWGIPHTGGEEVPPMARSYRDSVADRRAKLTSEAREQSKVFGEAYDLAVQVMELREKHGLTQAELADRCGIDQADISRIERGSTSPTARTLQRIADSLGADVRLVERAS